MNFHGEVMWEFPDSLMGHDAFIGFIESAELGSIVIGGI